MLSMGYAMAKRRIAVNEKRGWQNSKKPVTLLERICVGREPID
jgi:hypothetical protein